MSLVLKVSICLLQVVENDNGFTIESAGVVARQLIEMGCSCVQVAHAIRECGELLSLFFFPCKVENLILCTHPTSRLEHKQTRKKGLAGGGGAVGNRSQSSQLIHFPK